MRTTLVLLAAALFAAADDRPWLRLEPGRELRFRGTFEQTMVRDGQKLRHRAESLQRIFVLAPPSEGRVSIGILTQYPGEQYMLPEVSLLSVDPGAPRLGSDVSWPVPPLTRGELEGGKPFEDSREADSGLVKVTGRVERREGRVLVIYELATPFEKGGEKLESWREEYTLDLDAGAVLASRLEVTATGASGPATITSRFEAEPSRAAEAEKARSALEELRTILLLFAEAPSKAKAALQGFAERHPGLDLEETARQLEAWADLAAEEEKAQREEEAKLVGKPAPAFTLKDLDGREVSLSDFRGKVVFLSFWGVG